ncbi:hypothetical protein LTR67_011107 [Exophiala xenobiotica]
MPTRTLVDKARRAYECGTCQKSFKRREHCARHERGHTNDKPYGCRFCPRKYARKDLMSRHEQSFHPHGDVIVLDTGPDAPNGTLQAQESLEADEPKEALNENHEQHTEPIGRSQESDAIFFGHSQDADMVAHTLETDENVVMNIPGMVSPANAQASHYGDSTSDQVYNPDGTINMGVSWNPELLVDNSFGITPGGTGFGHHGDVHEIDFFNILPTLSNGPVDMDFTISNYLLNSGYSPTSSGNNPTRTNTIAGQCWPDANIQINNDAPLGSPVPTNQQTPTSDTLATKHAPGSFARIPSIISTNPSKITIPILSEENYHLVVKDARSRLTSDQFANFRLPSALKLHQFATSYFTCFHHHFPILHIPTLFISHSHYSPMILATCSIGALYRLNRKVARELWQFANMMLDRELERRSDALMRPYPTPVMQAKLLLTVHAVFSGDPEIVVSATERTAWWSTEYRLRRGGLEQQPDISSSPWEDWCEREMSKRLLCGIFILNSLLTVTYDTTPFLNLTQDLNLEVPEEENRWEARTAHAWQDALQTSTPLTRTTIRAALSELVFDSLSTSSSLQPKHTWSGLGLVVVMHAVNVHMWHTMQCTPCFSGLHSLSPPSFAWEVVRQIESALTRCHILISSSAVPVDAAEEASSLLFNCQALLRIAYVRVFTGAGSFNRMMLLSSNEDEVMHNLRTYVHAPQQRTKFLTTAVGKAYEGFLAPIKAGYLISRKTAALSWSVEHAVAGWDCALFVTKWVHILETHSFLLSTPSSTSALAGIPPIAAEELTNMQNLRMLLAEVDSEYREGKSSLAAEVVRTWAEFLDDTWVWGATPRMGTVLRALGKVYDEEWKRMRGLNA